MVDSSLPSAEFRFLTLILGPITGNCIPHRSGLRKAVAPDGLDTALRLDAALCAALVATGGGLSQRSAPAETPDNWKASPMRYEAPQTLESAVALLAETGSAQVLAGGTDLLVRMKSDLAAPDLVVDIKRIPAMRAITAEAGGWRIGAAVSGAELGEHDGVKAAWPGVVEAAELIGSTQIQGRATMAGNLCNASPAADSVPALVAADATVRVVGPNGSRDVAVADVATGPGTTSLAKGEIVESIFLPARPDRSGDAYLRFIPRTEMDIAVVGCGISLTLDAAGTCTAARVALGAVAPTVLLVEDAAAALVGTSVDDAALDALAAACSAACRPIDDKRGTIDFRTKVAGVLARRAATIALARAKG
jgi:CO/xanthine dehydrogenase FAD-binding subunit